MTFDRGGSDRAGFENPRAEQSPEVLRARAELVSALEAIEDKINVPRRVKRFRAERPGTVNAILATAGTVAAGIITLVIVGAARKK